MAEFDQAISFVLGNEGGLSNDPFDAGGLTNFGISQHAHPTEDIKNLTRDRAIEIYRNSYWEMFPYDQIISQRVATKLFDMVVNMGPMKAVRIIQLALGSIEAGPLVADGILGSHTIESLNAADESKLMDEIKARLCKFYCELGQPEFVLGWMRRAVKG